MYSFNGLAKRDKAINSSWHQKSGLGISGFLRFIWKSTHLDSHHRGQFILTPPSLHRYLGCLRCVCVCAWQGTEEVTTSVKEVKVSLPNALIWVVVPFQSFLSRPGSHLRARMSISKYSHNSDVLVTKMYEKFSQSFQGVIQDS